MALDLASLITGAVGGGAFVGAVTKLLVAKTEADDRKKARRLEQEKWEHEKSSEFRAEAQELAKESLELLHQMNGRVTDIPRLRRQWLSAPASAQAPLNEIRAEGERIITEAGVLLSRFATVAASGQPGAAEHAAPALEKLLLAQTAYVIYISTMLEGANAAIVTALSQGVDPESPDDAPEEGRAFRHAHFEAVEAFGKLRTAVS